MPSLKTYLDDLCSKNHISNDLAEYVSAVWARIQQKIPDMPEPDAAYGDNVDCMLSWIVTPHYLECEILSDGDLEFFYKNTYEVWGEDYSPDQPFSIELIDKFTQIKEQHYRECLYKVTMDLLFLENPGIRIVSKLEWEPFTIIWENGLDLVLGLQKSLHSHLDDHYQLNQFGRFVCCRTPPSPIDYYTALKQRLLEKSTAVDQTVTVIDRILYLLTTQT